MHAAKLSWLALLAAAVIACDLSFAPPTPQTIVVFPATPLPTAIPSLTSTLTRTATITLTPTSTPTATVTETPPPPTDTPLGQVVVTVDGTLVVVTAAPVIITAATASLNIRRGPGTDYDILATLNEGQSAVAVARSAHDEWFLIPLPNDPTQTGWVSWSAYASLVGDTEALPIQAVDPAVAARVRNCTFARLVIREPKLIYILGQGSPDANTIRINPGYYKIYNADVKSHPLVFKGEIREGDLIKITNTIDENGTPVKYACPGA